MICSIFNHVYYCILETDTHVYGIQMINLDSSKLTGSNITYITTSEAKDPCCHTPPGKYSCCLKKIKRNTWTYVRMYWERERERGGRERERGHSFSSESKLHLKQHTGNGLTFDGRNLCSFLVSPTDRLHRHFHTWRVTHIQCHIFPLWKLL